jgi:hypothetical protein
MLTVGKVQKGVLKFIMARDRARDLRERARDRATYFRDRPTSYINLSRRLVRWMKQIRLPRTALRMRYISAIHAYHVLDGSCSHLALINAMQTLLAGYNAVDEGQYAQYHVDLGEALRRTQMDIVEMNE